MESDAARLWAYDAYLFDVDGTLLYGDVAVPGAAACLTALQRADKRVVMVTNNSTYRRSDLGERFRRSGLPVGDNAIFTALEATAQLVAREALSRPVLVFGDPGLAAELEEAGLTLTTDADAAYVVVGNCHQPTFERLTQALRALANGARFVAVNRDRAYVAADGGLAPGAGVFVDGLARGAGRAPDVVVGKPAAALLHEAAAHLKLPSERCVYVGDNADVDVRAAHAAGMEALLVLTGVSTLAEAREAAPDHVLLSLNDLVGLSGSAALRT